MNLFKINLGKFGSELAEIVGIHAGDGYLRYKGKRKEIDISGGYEEKEYYDKHVIPLFNETFGLSISGKFFPSRSTYGFVIRDINVLNLFKEFGFPSGKKSYIVKCPKFILKSKNNELLRSFIRGCFDTDGSLTFDKKICNKDNFKKTRNFYPRLIFSSTSKDLSYNFFKIINILGFKAKIYIKKSRKKTENLKYIVQLNGVNNLIKWLSEIEIKNTSKFSRYLVWKEFGFCPPNTTYKQRLNILNGNLDPNQLYEGL
ncbi:hypothetical protein K8R47_03655 [archaeon]|nr:hypothetical protein [archaeon]